MCVWGGGGVKKKGMKEWRGRKFKGKVRSKKDKQEKGKAKMVKGGGESMQEGCARTQRMSAFRSNCGTRENNNFWFSGGGERRFRDQNKDC